MASSFAASIGYGAYNDDTADDSERVRMSEVKFSPKLYGSDFPSLAHREAFDHHMYRRRRPVFDEQKPPVNEIFEAECKQVGNKAAVVGHVVAVLPSLFVGLAILLIFSAFVGFSLGEVWRGITGVFGFFCMLSVAVAAHHLRSGLRKTSVLLTTSNKRTRFTM